MGTSARKITTLGSRKKDLILRAAESEFERYGYGGARMQRIADIAEVPKANVHYYFANKQALYDAVLSNVVALWNEALAPIDRSADPATTLDQYVRLKVEFTRLYPSATRIFALELLNGGQHFSPKLAREIRKWTRARVKEIEHWIEQGKIDAIDPYHLIFLIWSSTQHYAESETQVLSIYQKRKLSKQDFDQLADSLSTMVLRICGLEAK